MDFKTNVQTDEKEIKMYLIAMKLILNNQI